MIKAIEKDFLNDNIINKSFIDNISLNDKLFFNKDNIYYFGNYKEDKLHLIKDKLLKNKKRLIKAIEDNVKFIICGNSIELFNNTFKRDDLNIYTSNSSFIFKKKFNKLVIKKRKKDINLKTIYTLNKVIDSTNFKYKNFICINNINQIDKIIKKTKRTTLSY